jgi:hypothetical protein
VPFPIQQDLDDVDTEILTDTLKFEKEILEALVQRRTHQGDEAILMYLELAVEVVGDVALEELAEHLVLVKHRVHGRSPLSLLVQREVVVIWEIQARGL